MNCRDIEPLIYLQGEGELTVNEKSRVAEHILTCPHCEELARSVRKMASVVSKADYYANPQIDDELFTRHLLQKIKKPGRSYSFILAKAAAACLLIFLASTFILQERNFSRSRTDLQFRMHREDPAMSDCIRELRRKIHYQSLSVFARRDIASVNLINEETLTAYVRENCGYNKSDIKALKKLLIQAGLSD